MRYLLTNLLLGFSWAALMGEISLGNVLVGFALGFIILSRQKWEGDSSAYASKAKLLVVVLWHFVVDIFMSNLRVASDVIRPRYRARPGIIAVPLEAETEIEILLLSTMVTLTPGTLSLDVSKDRGTLYVHTMYSEDAEAVVRQIKERVEKPLLELLR